MDTPLNPHYNFGTFVVGEGNKWHTLQHLPLPKAPAAFTTHSLFMGVGLGKTHLMEAIGNPYASS